MYPEIMVIPMREELTRLGIEELRTAEDVDRALKGQAGTAMVIVNSICGCAAGRMRPAVRMALEKATHPDRAFTVFAAPGHRIAGGAGHRRRAEGGARQILCASHGDKIKRRDHALGNTSSRPISCFLAIYFFAIGRTMNAFTTMALGCIPTGIMVSSEYSEGSSLRGVRFWITVTSPAWVSSTRRYC
jgi:hypothetical protein